MSDDHPYRPAEEHYDYIDDDTGHAMKERQARQNTHEADLTVIYRPGDRVTKNPDLLVIEAELAADPDRSVENPARPATSDVANAAMRQIADADLEPAWKGT